ncbi:MAG: hypothetical protein J6B29_03620 [Clostridia bacterium]|nr:hypothetical protein [Clostridia bacterium]
MTNIPKNNNVSPETASSIVGEKTKTQKMLLAFKIIGTVFYVVMTAILVWVFIDALPSNNPVPEDAVNLNGLGFVLVVIIFSAIGFFAYLVPTVLGIIGSIVTKAKYPSKFNKIYFLVMSILPILTDVLFFCTLFFVEG